MPQLTDNWFAEGLQDFEYKRYLLLAYLQEVKEKFAKTELYPAFSELINHYQNLIQFRESKNALQSQFPKKLAGLSVEKLKLLYKALEDDERLSELEDIVNYAVPLVKHHLEEGKEIFEFIDESIEIESIGLLPLNKSEGYFLLRGGDSKTIKAYEYRVTIFESAQEKFRGLQTEFLREFTLSIVNTFESIKLDLIRLRRNLPNPATFAICSRFNFPPDASLVPVARRKFMRHLATFAA